MGGIMKKEYWKPVVGYEGHYEVSNWGRVKSLKRNLIKKLKLTYENRYVVSLWKNGKSKTYSVHRLVAEAFILNPDNLPQVNHKDENPLNNVVSNLEWVSAKYNCNYGTRNERISKKKSKPVLQYTLDGELVKEWESAMQASKYGFDNSEIGKCCRNYRNYMTHKGFIWRYK